MGLFGMAVVGVFILLLPGIIVCGLVDGKRTEPFTIEEKRASSVNTYGSEELSKFMEPELW